MTKDNTMKPDTQPSEAQEQTTEKARLMLEAQKDAAKHRATEGGYQ